jgi:membrane protease YdiL (CAAX protease family)
VGSRGRPRAQAVAVDAAVAALLIGYHGGVDGRGARHHRVAANLTAAGAALVAARAAGISTDELGLARRDLGAGLRVGALGAAAVAVVLAAASAWAPGREALASAPVDDDADLAFDVLVRVPFETALAEELLFRGVEYALARRHGSHRYATFVTTIGFGFWHVGPALRRSRRHRDAAGAATVPHGVAVDVGVTALANVVLVALRRRSGSVLAPVLVHAAVNAGALTAPAVLGWIRE